MSVSQFPWACRVRFVSTGNVKFVGRILDFKKLPARVVGGPVAGRGKVPCRGCERCDCQSQRRIVEVAYRVALTSAWLPA